MKNPLSGTQLQDGTYILGTRPTTEEDGIPKFMFSIKDTKISSVGGSNAGKEFKETFEGSINFILHSGDWCTQDELNESNNLTKYMVVALEDFR